MAEASFVGGVLAVDGAVVRGRVLAVGGAVVTGGVLARVIGGELFAVGESSEVSEVGGAGEDLGIEGDVSGEGIG